MFKLEQDERNLELLSVFHYVLGVLTALFSCIPLVHLSIGMVMLSYGFSGGDAALDLIGLLFIILPGTVILIGWTMAVLILVAGSRLKNRRSYNFCLSVSFLECLIIPLGTVLGVFTIVHLTRDSVKELFLSPGQTPVE